MVLTYSTMMDLGTTAPDFNLRDVVSGESWSLGKLKGKKALLVMFICSHCPYVKHVETEVKNIGNEYIKKEVGVIAISSNDPDYDHEDRPDGLKEQAEKLNFQFPYLFDETQEVAKNYTAACTPDFFLFDYDGKLVYRGQLDDSRPGNGKPVTGEDLRAALESTLSGEKLDIKQKPSAGCNIKWKSGNEPDYF